MRMRANSTAARRSLPWRRLNINRAYRSQSVGQERARASSDVDAHWQPSLLD